MTNGFQSERDGAEKIEKGLNEVSSNLTVLYNATSELHKGYQQLGSTIGSYDKYSVGISSSIEGAKQGY